jgi:tRNA pseudouridine32 synthase/23S rRNA pseudouridine746 synthase
MTPLDHRGTLALYQLEPHTGQRHQLRVHMAALGLPIVNDGIYPTLTPEGPPDYGKPLQLLAHSLAFTDPLTGEHRVFSSTRRLQWD